MGKVTRGNKYNAKRTEYDGRWYDSQREALRAEQLDLAQKAGHIKGWKPQVRIPLGPDEIMRLDFRVLYVNGDVRIEEVKGGPPPGARGWVKWRATGMGKRYGRLIRLWKKYGPCTLCVLFPKGERDWERQWVPGAKNKELKK